MLTSSKRPLHLTWISYTYIVQQFLCSFPPFLNFSYPPEKSLNAQANPTPDDGTDGPACDPASPDQGGRDQIAAGEQDAQGLDVLDCNGPLDTLVDGVGRVFVFPDDHEQREELHIRANEESGTNGRRGRGEWGSSDVGRRMREGRGGGYEEWRKRRGCRGGGDGGRRMGRRFGHGRSGDGSGRSLHGDGVTHDPFGGQPAHGEMLGAAAQDGEEQVEGIL